MSKPDGQEEGHPASSTSCSSSASSASSGFLSSRPAPGTGAGIKTGAVAPESGWLHLRQTPEAYTMTTRHAILLLTRAVLEWIALLLEDGEPTKPTQPTEPAPRANAEFFYPIPDDEPDDEELDAALAGGRRRRPDAAAAHLLPCRRICRSTTWSPSPSWSRSEPKRCAGCCCRTTWASSADQA